MVDFFFDSAVQKKVSEKVGEGVTVFTQNFANSYKTCYIQSIKEEAQPKEEAVYLLSKPPVPSAELRKGDLSKRSDHLKQWRERSCVVTNEADNFVVNFFAGERKTGSASLCGYSAEKQDEGCGINLVPSNERRKTWFLRCKNEEEQAAWMDVFEIVCDKSEPPVSKDPIVRDAFSSALESTRAHFGFHGRVPVVMTEPETISDLVTGIVERDVLTEAHKSMGVVTKMVRSHVAVLVNASVGACWTSCMATVEPTKQAVDTAVRPVLTTFFEKEGEVKEKITEAVGATVNPFMEEHSKKTLEPVLECVSGEIVSAFTSTVTEFHKTVGEAAAKEEFKSEEGRAALLLEIESAIAVQGGVLAVAKKGMDECVKSKFSKIAGLLDKGFSVKSLAQKVLSSNQQLASYALFTFTEKLKELGADADASVALNDTVAKMIGDAVTYYKALLENILGCVLADPIAETVTPPCTAAVEPVQETINGFEGLSDFFQLDSMTEDCVGDIVGNGISAASEGAVSKGTETIAALKGELKV